MQNYTNWTPAGNAWQPPLDAGDAWTGANNPFGPKIPLGAHGAYGSAPPTASGWSSGECNFNGQAQCGMGPAPKVWAGGNNPYAVKAPPQHGITALMHAVIGCQLACLKYLIVKGANLDATDKVSAALAASIARTAVWRVCGHRG